MPILNTTNVTNPLFTDKVIKVLIQNKINTTLEFLREDLDKIGIITKLSLPDILAIRTEIFEKYSAPVLTVLRIYNANQKRFLDTGIERFNRLLEGGLPLKNITEFCGLAGSGKTQLCLSLSVSCAQLNKNSILYIDTKGDFSAMRIQKILEKKGFSHKEMATIMNRIKIIRIWNMEELVQIFNEIKQNIISIEELALIIIDSLPCLMFQHVGENCKVGLILLNKFVNLARYLCDILNLSIICVNIITRWVEQDFSELEETTDRSTIDATWKETKSRCLGRYWQHIPAFVVMLEHFNKAEGAGQNINIKAVLSKSINQKCNVYCNLTINAFGVS